jgi:hypothetical protein
LILKQDSSGQLIHHNYYFCITNYKSNLSIPKESNEHSLSFAFRGEFAKRINSETPINQLINNPIKMKKQLQNSVKFLRKETKLRKCLLAAVFIAASFQQSNAQTYPFPLPTTVTATLNVQTQQTETFNNLLLGINMSGFTSATDVEQVQRWNPITIRFPSGLFSNWYDYTNDQTRVYGTETFNYINGSGVTKTTSLDHLSDIQYAESQATKTGIDGMPSLNNQKKNQNGGVGYDFLWTFNMSADGINFSQSPATIARYYDLKSRGLPVKFVEMGNECFYPGQRSSIIPNSAQYIARAKNISQSLKAKDPTIKVSIPLLRRGSVPNPNWNAELTADMTYFDAVTVHTYIGHNPDDANTSDDSYATALNARSSLETSTNDYVRPYSQWKPIWLSEWGVKSGGPNAASVLGMADCYLFMAENQNIYQRANWYTSDAVANSFYKTEYYVTPRGNIASRIVIPNSKSVYGSMYEIAKDVLENSTMLDGTMTTATIGTGKAVTGRAVTKNGQTSVLVLNMTNKPATFTLKFDGVNYAGSFKHEAMKFTSLSEERYIGMDANPLSLVKQGTGTITLPPLSVNVLSNLTIPAPAQLPYTTARPVPGLIEAEDFDKGGEAVAYHDSNVGNTGGVYRTNEDVDLGTIPSSQGGGYCVGWTNTGEWMEYKVHVLAAGNYNLRIRYSSGTAGAQIGASFPDEGITLFSNLDLAQTTGGYDGYTVRTKYTIPLAAGYHTLRISIDQKGFNLDNVEFVEPAGGIAVAPNGVGTVNSLELDTNSTNKVVVYPNPSNSGVFTISKAGSWKVYNLSGAKVLEGKGDKIDLSGFAKGMYTLQTETSTHKLIYQ